MRIKSAIKSVFKSRRIPKSPTAARLTKAPSTKLERATVESMLKNTYQPGNLSANVGSYTEDRDLSNNRVKVYHDPTTKHTVVAHRGSASKQDWLENAMYAVGFRGGANYKHSREKQKKAQIKYGTENLTTIGHSKGALHAQDFGQEGDIVTLNKPVNIKDALRFKVPKYQTDYRGGGDIVSGLRGLQRGAKPVTLRKEKKSFSTLKALRHPINYILEEHSIDTLSR
jgi:hypothetical protein